jgi:hypothetical protein
LIFFFKTQLQKPVQQKKDCPEDAIGPPYASANTIISMIMSQIDVSSIMEFKEFVVQTQQELQL